MLRRLLFIFVPIIVALLIFAGFSLFLSTSLNGKGALQVTSVPQSNVYLNGKLVGKTPLCKCEGSDMLPTGDYTLRLVPLEGNNLSPYEQRVAITKSILTVVDRTFGIGASSTGSVITLAPLSDNAVKLSITSFPSDASILVDGNDAGKTPLVLSSLTASDHELTLTKSGYQDKTIHLHTAAGYQLDALITLSASPLDATAAAAFTASSSATPTQGPKVLILSTPTGFLRVHAEPSISASETAQVNPGETYDYITGQDGWYEIKLPSGQDGWISSSYAKKQ
ncbi:MAG TPA: PEGA domain-containing protein [Candidatus Saccharimonadales bacterium]|nr:PEGA domain-containing protein [Candidatus Saccharimonadales bacterium]